MTGDWICDVCGGTFPETAKSESCYIATVCEKCCDSFDHKRSLEQYEAAVRYYQANVTTGEDRLRARVAELEAAIRSHRDQRGDDRCWLDDETLYRVLPEGFTPPVRDCAVELHLCEKFIATRHRPDCEYVSPQRRIEDLEAENATLRAVAIDLAECMDDDKDWDMKDLCNVAREALGMPPH